MSKLYEEKLLNELRKIRRNIQNNLTQPDILFDVRFFSRSYLEMSVLDFEEIDYFCFNNLRNCFGVHVTDTDSLLRKFCLDIIENLHLFALQSMDHSLRFAVECCQFIQNDIYYRLKKDMLTEARMYDESNGQSCRIA